MLSTKRKEIYSVTTSHGSYHQPNLLILLRNIDFQANFQVKIKNFRSGAWYQRWNQIRFQQRPYNDFFSSSQPPIQPARCYAYINRSLRYSRPFRNERCWWVSNHITISTPYLI